MTHKPLHKNTPKGWQQVRLGEVATITRGGSPRPIEDFITKEEDGLNWLRIGDIELGAKYVAHTTQKIKKEGLTKTTLVKKGDFILSNSMSFGRPYIMKTEACIHDGWLAFKDIKVNLTNAEFLYYLFTSGSLQSIFKTLAAGSGVKNLKKESVANISVVLPPIIEQEKISEMLTLVDEEIKKTEEIITKTEKLKRGLMQSLLSVGKKSKISQVSEINPEQINPEQYPEQEYQYVDIGSITNYSIVGEKTFLGADAPSRARRLVMDHDILVSTVRPNLRAFGFVSLTAPNTPLIVSTGFCVLRSKKDLVNSKFLYYIILQNKFVEYLVGKAKGSNYPAVNPTDIGNFICQIPEMNQQEKAVAVLSEIDKKIELNRKLKEKLTYLKKGLMQDLLSGKVRV